MFGHGIDICLGAPTVAAMDTSESEVSVKQLSGLEKQVVRETFGSWMVVEHRKGHERQAKDGNEGGICGIARGSRFAVLNEMEDLIEGEIDGMEDKIRLLEWLWKVKIL